MNDEEARALFEVGTKKQDIPALEASLNVGFRSGSSSVLVHMWGKRCAAGHRNIMACVHTPEPWVILARPGDGYWVRVTGQPRRLDPVQLEQPLGFPPVYTEVRWNDFQSLNPDDYDVRFLGESELGSSAKIEIILRKVPPPPKPPKRQVLILETQGEQRGLVRLSEQHDKFGRFRSVAFLEWRRFDIGGRFVWLAWRRKMWGVDGGAWTTLDFEQEPHPVFEVADDLSYAKMLSAC